MKKMSSGAVVAISIEQIKSCSVSQAAVIFDVVMNSTLILPSTPQKLNTQYPNFHNKTQFYQKNTFLNHLTDLR